MRKNGTNEPFSHFNGYCKLVVEATRKPPSRQQKPVPSPGMTPNLPAQSWSGAPIRTFGQKAAEVVGRAGELVGIPGSEGYFTNFEYAAEKKYYLNPRKGFEIFGKKRIDALQDLQKQVAYLKNNPIKGVIMFNEKRDDKPRRASKPSGSTAQVRLRKMLKQMEAELGAESAILAGTAVGQRNFTKFTDISKQVAELKQQLTRYEPKQQNPYPDTPMLPGSTIFTEDGHVIDLTKWEEFLDTLEDIYAKLLATGSSWGGYAPGANLIEILNKEVETEPEYHGRRMFGRRRTVSKFQRAIPTETLQKIHYSIMIPAFVQPDVLVYLTGEQYAQKAKGGRLKKAVKGGFGAVAKSLWTAGKNAPTVRTG